MFQICSIDHIMADICISDYTCMDPFFMCVSSFVEVVEVGWKRGGEWKWGWI